MHIFMPNVKFGSLAERNENVVQNSLSGLKNWYNIQRTVKTPWSAGNFSDFVVERDSLTTRCRRVSTHKTDLATVKFGSCSVHYKCSHKALWQKRLSVTTRVFANVKWLNSAWRRTIQLQISMSDFVVCTETPVWTIAASQGGWNPLKTETRASPISHVEVDRVTPQMKSTNRKLTHSSKWTEVCGGYGNRSSAWNRRRELILDIGRVIPVGYEAERAAEPVWKR